MQTERQAKQQSRLSAEARARFLASEGPPPLLSDWLDCVMIHYEVDAAALQREIPFELDCFNGRAFVTLVAFTMSDLRTQRWPRLGRRLFQPIGTHAFLNIRTYVRVAGETGIYFLAEYLPNRLSAMLGPVAYGLPYRFGRIAYNHDADAETMTGVVMACTSKSVEVEGDAQSRVTGCSPESVRELEHPFRVNDGHQAQTQDCTSTALRSSFVLGSRRSLFQSEMRRRGAAEIPVNICLPPGVSRTCSTGDSPHGVAESRATGCLPLGADARSGSVESEPGFGNIENPSSSAVANHRRDERSDSELQYRVKRAPAATLEPAQSGSLTEFLMERYTAFTKWAGIVRRFRIWHEPWPQHAVEPEILEDSLLQSTGEWANTATLHSANYSPGLSNVWMGRPRRMRDDAKRPSQAERGRRS